MAVFAYTAIDTDASAISGILTADTPRQARDSLRSRGLTVQEVTPCKAQAPKAPWRRRSARQHAAKVVSFTRELSTLLAVGIPLLEALDTVIKQRRGAFRSTLLLLRDRVAAGVGLAEAMGEQPHVFDELCVNVTEVGENAGTLESVLSRFADFSERSAALKNRVFGALLYPSIVLLVGVLVSVFLMTIVVPNLVGPLTQAGRPLPWATRVVMTLSQFLVSWWWLLLASVAGAVALSGLVLRSPRGRLAWHAAQLRVPIVGEMIRKQTIVRIAIVVSTLLRSGVLFSRAVQMAQRSTRNVVLRRALEQCEAAVQGGQDIGKALERTGAFPPTVVQIFSVGQHTGRLEEMLERLAADYDQQVASASQRLAAALEPVMILLLAVIVGVIAFATVSPILEAGNVL